MPTTKKPWTFMVYMAGDNNLDPEGVVDLKEMKTVGSGPALNIVAQFDRHNPHIAKRYFLTKGGTVKKDVVDQLGKVNTGDPKQLIEFVTWAVKTYPADRYALILWNHGQGWDDTDIYKADKHRSFRRLATGRIQHALFHSPVRKLLKRAPTDPSARAILLDDDARDFLDNIEMKQVLARTKALLKKKLDLLGLDACLMGMAEVGYQSRQSVEFLVGSEEVEPGEGWPYNTVLREIAKNPAITTKKLSQTIVEKYAASYTPGYGVTQSACDLSKAEALAAAVKALGTALTAAVKSPASQSAVFAARGQVQSYDTADNIDLVDLCKLLKKGLPGSAVAKRADAVIAACKNTYVIAHEFKGAKLVNSNGLAIYFPTQELSPLYARLDFCKKTGWQKFIKAYLAARRNH